MEITQKYESAILKNVISLIFLYLKRQNVSKLIEKTYESKSSKFNIQNLNNSETLKLSLL